MPGRKLIRARVGLLAGCLLVFAIGSASAAGTLRVATFNLQNYLIMDRVVEGHWRPAYPKPEVEKTALRQTIRAVEPDVLLLQELGGADFLEELRLDLAAEGLDYSYATVLEAADEIRRVGVLSRVEPQEVLRHTDLDFKYYEARLPVKRGLLELCLALPEGRHLHLFNVHLKSRLTDEPRDPQSAERRAREAEACRERIIERMQGQDRPLYLVAGDFNDHPGSAPIRRFLRKGDRVLGHLLPAGDSRGHVWTHYYAKQGSYSQVDGFIVSPELRSRVREGRGHIYDGPGSEGGSDHRLVYVDLDW